MAATIRDVARHARVSTATVSHVLNNTRPVHADTVRRVHRAMEELGYTPNLVARSLRSKSTSTLGLVVPVLTNPYFAELTAEVADQTTARGYQLLIAASGGDSQREIESLRELHQRQVDGVLVVGTAHGSSDTARGDLPSPTVFVDRAAPGHYSVLTDGVLGGRLAMRHLLSLGHELIGLVVGDRDTANIQDRVLGAMAELDEAGIHVEPNHVFYGKQDVETGLEAMRHFRALGAPTALFATNDVVAFGIAQEALRAGLKLGSDLSVVGFDDIHWAELTVPRLTTVAQPVKKMVERALEVLADMASGAEPDRELELLEPRLVVRESTGAPGTSTPEAAQAGETVEREHGLRG